MAQSGKAKIAIINCEKEDATLLFSALFDAGYSVASSAKGSPGLDIITKEKPDLIILDIMAQNMSGLALLDILQARNVTTPILVITVPELVSDNLAQRGIAGLLIKPIDKERMLTHVEAILDLQEISRVYSDRDSVSKPAPETVSEPTMSDEPPPPKPAEEPAAPKQTPPLQAVPEAPRPIRAGIKQAREEEAKTGKPAVLVVDDEPDMRTLLSDLLSFSGFEVLTAEDGVEGLKMAQQNRPDAILLDIMLPKLDGFQVCRLLKFNEKFAEIPIIMLTARNHPKDRELAEGSGANGYIVKPFETKQLVEELKKVISASARQGNSVG